MPFLDNMLFSFFIISAIMVMVSLQDKGNKSNASTWELPVGIFKNTDKVFRWLSVGIILILSFLYFTFW